MDFPHHIFRMSSAPTPRSVTFELSTTSRNQKTISRSLVGQVWEVDFNGFVQPWDVDEFNAFYFPLRKTQTPFLFTMPRYGFSEASNKIVTSSASPLSTSVQLSDVVGIKAGQYFKFDNHEKVYMVESIAGNVVTMFPRLQRTITTLTTAVFDTVQFQLFLDGDVKEHRARSTNHPVNYRFRTREL